MATHSSTLAGKSHGWRSLVGYSPWGRKESDTTERLHFISLHSHFMGGVKWSISCHVSKDVTSTCDLGLPRCEFLGRAGKLWQT